MTTRARGRPSANDGISPATILTQALEILDAEGLERLTMRTLAGRVGINPMTIYHHFSDRDGLIGALGDMVYADVAAPPAGDPRMRLAGLLAAYRAKVVRHPALTMAIFSRPAVFPEHAQRITATLEHLLGELGLSPHRAMVWVHILVDFTHGAALAVALGHETVSLAPARTPTDDGFEAGVAELLDTLARTL